MAWQKRVPITIGLTSNTGTWQTLTKYSIPEHSAGYAVIIVMGKEIMSCDTAVFSKGVVFKRPDKNTAQIVGHLVDIVPKVFDITMVGLDMQTVVEGEELIVRAKGRPSTEIEWFCNMEVMVN